MRALRGVGLRPLRALGLCLLAIPSAALDPDRAVTQYRRDAWTTREGLPQSSVESLAQTSDGYVWLGTQEGLAQFDGVRITVFDKSNTKALRHNRVTALLADRQGSLWVGTEGGGVARLQGREWTDLSGHGLPNLRVRALAEDAEGTVWVGTDAGLARVEGGRFVQHAEWDARLLGPIQALHAGPDRLFVGVKDALLALRDGGRAAQPIGGLPSGPVKALWQDKDGMLWVGTTQGLYAGQPGGGDLRPRGEVKHRVVTVIRRDRHGSLWVGTEAGGLVRVSPGSVSTLNTGRGVVNDQVLSLLEDREGSLWVGTQDGGVNRLGDAKFKTYSAAEGVAGDIVWPVFADRDGNVWIGTKSGGLSRFRDGRFTTFSTAQGLSGNAVQSIAQDADGSLWIGTRNSGLNRLRDGRFKTYSTRHGLPHDSVSALLASRDGGLWIGTRGGGLGRFQDGKFKTWTTRDGLPNDTIHFLLEDRQGALWIATNGGGLARFQGGRFEAFTARDGLSSEIVNVVHEDAQGTLWVGTFGGGLNRRRPDGRFTAYTTTEGLYDDAIFSILEDANGRLWMSCNKGIFRVDKRELDALDRKEVEHLHPVSYGVEDGMKNRECNGANQPPAWRDTSGRLWFPTIEGVAVVDPNRLAGNPLAPPVSLEQIVVDGRSVAPREGLSLAPGARDLEFHYVAPSFVAPARVRYRYRLEGLDTDWVEAGARRAAYYSRLPPGPYRFRVTAANDEGVWNEEGAALPFSVRPRIYETPWFYAVCGLALAGVVWGGDRLRVRRVRTREEALERLVEERTRALAEANLRLERLSSLDGLTGVANRRRFDEALDLEWRRASRAGTPVSLVMLDIDFFKDFNDTNGHLAGDERLRLVAQALAGALGRAGDLVARYGGEEFVVLLPGMASPDAWALAERLRSSVEALGLSHNASAVSSVVTLSAGVATAFAEERTSPAALLAAADEALYRAKREGRNRVAGTSA